MFVLGFVVAVMGEAFPLQTFKSSHVSRHTQRFLCELMGNAHLPLAHVNMWRNFLLLLLGMVSIATEALL